MPTHPSTSIRPPGLRVAGASLAALLTFATASAAAVECQESGRNMQCGELGTIRMDAMREISKEPIQVTLEVILESTFTDRGARWFLFSVRNLTADGQNPVHFTVDSFTASGASIVFSRAERSDHEVNFWVDAQDVPARTPIHLDLTVGATEPGAYQLEALVMPFDRGYSPLHDSRGTELSLYSFTLLGVNHATAPLGAAGARNYPVPGPEIPLLLLALGGLASARRGA